MHFVICNWLQMPQVCKQTCGITFFMNLISTKLLNFEFIFLRLVFLTEKIGRAMIKAEIALTEVV